MTGAGDEEVCKESSVVLNLLWDFDGGLDFPSVAVIADGEILLLENEHTVGRLVGRHNNRRRDIDTDINGAIGRPNGSDQVGDRVVVGDFAGLRTIRKRRDIAWARLIASILLVVEELADDELHQQKDTETLKGTLEATARLDDRQ